MLSISRSVVSIALFALVSGLSTPALAAPEAQAYAPVTIDNCGVTTTYQQPPQRAVTLNQHATEVMLALGLEDHMIGTAYLDDTILPQYGDAYQSVPVLAVEYPSKEVLVNAGPDFIYGGFASAFREPDLFTREELDQFGTSSYLTGAACLDGRPLALDDIYTDILNIGRIFGVEARATRLVTDMRAGIDDALARIPEASRQTRVMLYDSETDAPFVAACCGAGGLAITVAGGVNVFDDLPGGWQNANWETVVARNPDVIVLVQADWSSAQEKAAYLLATPSLATVNAVHNVRFVTVPFTSTSPGVRVPTLVRQLAVALYPEFFE
jgi:iron complex transport system substrate-binding protein